jgi:hypothetical protein
VAELLDTAAALRHERERKAEAARAEQEARREQQRAAAREKRLDAIARDPEITWARVDELIDARKPSDYDVAVELLKDLRAIADRDGLRQEFPARLTHLRGKHHRKTGLIARFDRAALPAARS